MRGITQVGLATGVLTTEEINYIEKAIVKTVRPLLVGRQLLPIKPLPHAGFLKYTFYTETDMGEAIISMKGETESQDTLDLTEGSVKIPVIHKDYTLHWRDVLMRRQNGQDLNTQHAENAARQCAELEDKLILTGEYTGWRALGIEGFATATNRQTQAASGAWPTTVITDVAAAKQKLRAKGYYGPYRLVMRSTWYAKLEAMISNTEKWYFQAIGELIGGVENMLISDSLYASDGGTDNSLLIDIGEGNGHLLIGQDLANHLYPLKSMNLYGKVYECVVPAIKRPESICEITGLT